MDEFLEVERISYAYEDSLVLKDISFSVEKGAFLGIIGPNGAGKTTLLKTINRLLPVQEGKVSLQGLNIKQLPLRKIAQKISLVGQDIEVSFALTVLDLVLMGRSPHLERFKKETKTDLEIAKQCMEFTETLHLGPRQFKQLSAGERQRVILAKALAQVPELLLLDEPTAHLDIAHQIKIFDLLLNLNRQRGLTIIAVLHDLNLASEYCQELILLDRGQIISSGSCKDVLQYATIEKAYGTVVLVKENPLTQKPYVLPIPGRFTKLDQSDKKLNG